MNLLWADMGGQC
ncbi:hypothetical protein AZE42_08193 [Rhizopogon vesiculosus]|uniref:Uncharacterized protein n=1 Tax=Rhizopogon vesiculosus TaxID=180088 RepID=A0A1J8QIK4_9AGAM|nr:hypothetical protein AZE42_08193 [Rhizopogon vesiculosus]